MRKTALFTEEQMGRLNPDQLPRHIAFIPDGGRRWAKQCDKTFSSGYRSGADNLIEITKACRDIGVSFVTIYLFSTENWSRPQEEIETYMLLLEDYLVSRRQEMVDEGICFSTIGDVSRLPEKIQRELSKTVEATAKADAIELIGSFNYGSRDEICRAATRLLAAYKRGERGQEKVTEKQFASFLDTAKWPDPDLFIRTSGEIRLSNFLLWQLSYAELHFAPVLWPDFRPNHLLDAVIDYQSRERRLGGNA